MSMCTGLVILTSWLRASNLSIVNSMSTMTQIDNVNGVRLVNSNQMSPEGPIFFFGRMVSFFVDELFFFLKASSL